MTAENTTAAGGGFVKGFLKAAFVTAAVFCVTHFAVTVATAAYFPGVHEFVANGVDVAAEQLKEGVSYVGSLLSGSDNIKVASELTTNALEVVPST